MTKQQIEDWIKNEIKTHPEVAAEYKLQVLGRLRTELRTNERFFNRKGYRSYRDPKYASEMIELREKIQEVERKTDEELLVDKFILKYSGSLRSPEKPAEFIKSSTDEDHYIEGVFKNTIYSSYVRCKNDFEGRKHSQEFKNIYEIYQKGLEERDKFVKIGEESYGKLLAELEAKIQEYIDIDKKGPEVIQNIIAEELVENKRSCRALALMSVVDAFDQMGAHPAPKQAEKIQQIIELHDPSIVESAIQTMIDNPTKNMCALIRNINEAPAQSRKELRAMKAADVVFVVAGAVLAALGIAGASTGNPSLSLTTVLGVGNLGLGITGMLRHTRKTDNLDQKDVLVSGCIDDLLNQVVLEETFSKGLER